MEEAKARELGKRGTDGCFAGCGWANDDDKVGHD
jgi:hypothetical protein